MIYFVQNERSRDIKIGYSVDVRKRMAGIQTSTPDKLRLIGVTPGDTDCERALHRRFASLRVNGEWFREDGVLLGEIAELIKMAPQGAFEHEGRPNHSRRLNLEARATPEHARRIWGEKGRGKAARADTRERNLLISQMRQQGKTLRAIGKIFGISHVAVSRIVS